jgi:endonuclease VIII
MLESVEAVGKHLMMRFSGGLTLETHMRMTGSWHLYRTGERWRKAPHLMRCLIQVPDHSAVCFSAPLVRTFPTRATGTSSDPVAHLGPDLCLAASAEPSVIQQCVERMAAVEPQAQIGEVLLDQRIGNGIGNVYKSEVCWHEGVHPFTPLDRVTVEQRHRLIRTAGRLLRANLGPGRRRTVAEGLAVYGRRGSPCRRCGTAVRRATRGELARVSYWCPTCQPAVGVAQDRGK